MNEKMCEIRAEILLASYNGARYIREQIDSILGQKDDRWHLTISDDGSTDETREIVDDYIRRYPQRIRRIESDRRFGNARDHFFWLIGQCDADYMLSCDQDDRWYGDKLGKTLDALLDAERERGKDCPLLVFSDQTPTDGKLRPLAPSLMRYQNQFFEYFDYRSILMQNVVTGGAMGFNRALAKLAGQCKDPTQTIMHDWWMAAVAARFGKIVYIDERLGDYRQHGTNSVGAKDVRSLEYICNAVFGMQRIRQKILLKKQQAAVFVKTYDSALDDKDRIYLRAFVQKRSGWRFYWRHRNLIHGGIRRLGMALLG